MDVPLPPVGGLKEVIVGGGTKVKIPEEVTEPPEAVIATFPVVPVPTLATICVFEITVNCWAGVTPNLTTLVPEKLLPLIVTTVPFPPDEGEKLLITGGGINVNPESVPVP
jgi:hypothetical protein